MSEMPETLRNLGYHLRVMADKASEQIDADRLSRAADEVERADLPPTLSAAMELPEVWALIHAVVSQLTYMDMCGDHGDLYNRLKAALAAIKEPKT